MKTKSLADLKSQFSSVVSSLHQGDEVAITNGRNKEPLTTIIPQSISAQADYSVKLGGLTKLDWTYKLNNFEMKDEQLLVS